MNESVHSQTGKVLTVASIVTFLSSLDTTLLIPVMALYAAELGAGMGIIGLIIGLYSLTNTPANILSGRLIDRVGYKVPLIAGLIGDALSMVLYSLSRQPLHLALVRVFHGVSGGMVSPAAMSIFADFSGETRGKVMSIYGISLASATLIGFGLSGFFVSRLGFEAVFYLGAALLVVGVIVSLSLPGSGERYDGAVKKSSGVSWQKAKDLLGRKGLMVSYCSIFAQYFTFGGVVTLLPLHIRNLNMEAFHVGILLAVFAVVFIIVQFPIGILSDRVGRLIPTAFGLGLGVAALVIMPSATSFSWLAMTMALYGMAYGALFPSISALITDNTAPEERGLAVGIFHALLTAGVAIGAPVLGWVGGVVGVETGMLLSSGIMAAALVIVLSLARHS